MHEVIVLCSFDHLLLRKFSLDTIYITLCAVVVLLSHTHTVCSLLLSVEWFSYPTQTQHTLSYFPYYYINKHFLFASRKLKPYQNPNIDHLIQNTNTINSKTQTWRSASWSSVWSFSSSYQRFSKIVWGIGFWM